MNKPDDLSEAELEAMALWSAARQKVSALEKMAQEHPELFRRIASQVFRWPGLLVANGSSRSKMPSSWTRLG